MSKEHEIKTKMEQEQWLKMLFLLGYNLKIYLMQVGIGFWWEGIFLGGGGMSKFLAGSERTPHHLPVGKTLISTVVWNLFQGNLYTMFVILNIKFRVSNINWNLCQNTVKFQNMTSLVDKICTNMQTSTGYYLLN